MFSHKYSIFVSVLRNLLTAIILKTPHFILREINFTRQIKRNLKIMRSFILGYEKRIKDESQTKIDIHINLWRYRASNNNDIIIDFGFMIHDIKKVNKIIFFTPLKINQVLDLGGKIFNSNTISDAIFNERCEISNTYPKRRKVIKHGDYDSRNNKTEENDVFMIYSLKIDRDDNSQLQFNNKDNYSQIHINTSEILSDEEVEFHPDLEQVKKYYFRFRIHAKKGTKIIQNENERINPLQDISLRTTELIDFRINDLRSCSDEIKECFLKMPIFSINKVHYLIIRNSTDEFITVGDIKVKSRILENEVWKDYIKINDIDMIAYHFKNDSDDAFSFEKLARFKYPLNVGKRVMVYVGIIISISLISSGIFEIIKKYLI